MTPEPHTKEYLDQIHKEIFAALGRIESQTTKTNGRVTKLEKFMWTATGSVIIFGMLEFDKIISLFN